MTVQLQAGRASYQVDHAGAAVIAASQLGLVRDDAGFTDDLALVEVGPTVSVEDDFELPHGKRRRVAARGAETAFGSVNADGGPLEVTVRAYDDGVAFRYHVHLFDTATGVRLPD